MPPEDLEKAVRRRPFVPFRLHISDGTVYDVRHPEMLMVSMDSAIVGLPAKDKIPPAVGGYEIVDLMHIVRLEPLPVVAKAGGDGPAA